MAGMKFPPPGATDCHVRVIEEQRFPLLPRRLEDNALIHRVPVDNPARLYGFG